MKKGFSTQTESLRPNRYRSSLEQHNSKLQGKLKNSKTATATVDRAEEGGQRRGPEESRPRVGA